MSSVAKVVSNLRSLTYWHSPADERQSRWLYVSSVQVMLPCCLVSPLSLPGPCQTRPARDAIRNCLLKLFAGERVLAVHNRPTMKMFAEFTRSGSLNCVMMCSIVLTSPTMNVQKSPPCSSPERFNIRSVDVQVFHCPSEEPCHCRLAWRVPLIAACSRRYRLDRTSRSGFSFRCLHLPARE